jgi:hypothetical protein
MDEQNFSQLVNLIREIRARITYTEMELSAAELSEHFLIRNIDNTGGIWQSLFFLAGQVKSLTELYDNTENGFFLSVSDTTKEEICKDMVFIMNSCVTLYVKLQTTAPDKMINSVFFGIEENLELMARIKQFLIDTNLYTG